jgi:hypothetical protein
MRHTDEEEYCDCGAQMASDGACENENHDDDEDEYCGQSWSEMNDGDGW